LNKVVIAGGSGFIGRALVGEFKKAGYEVTVFSRSGRGVRGAEAVRWDAEHLGDWARELEGATALINLAGETIAQHWNDSVKAQLLSSRILSTRVLGEAIAVCASPPPVWINASGVGYYGDRGGEELTEASAAGPKGNFVADMAAAWEHEMQAASTPVRKAWIRTGMVLGRGGGAFEPLYGLTRWFMGGHVGSGAQFVSWIHLDDLARLYRWIVENPVEGAVNGTAPAPATNRFFMATLRGVVGRPWAPPVPAFMLRLVALLGGPPASLLLEGQRALPAVALERGFKFRYTDLSRALGNLVDRG
jgi:uncharacterized protein (TIGR01777 family)